MKNINYHIPGCLYINRLLTILLLASCFLLVDSGLSAAGKTSSEFLLIPKGARASAMAGAFTSVSDDSTAVFYNIAGLGFTNETKVSLSHSEWLEDMKFENVSCIMPLRNRFSLGFGIEYLGISGIKGMETQTSQIEEFSSHDLSSVIGISYLLNKNISFGLSSKYIESKIDDKKSVALAIDIGTIYEKKINSYKIFTAGLNIQNIELKRHKYIDVKENLPTKFVAGISYRPLGKILLMSSDFVLMRDSKPYADIGTEILIYDILNLRGGYKFDSSFETSSRITLGIGIVFDLITVDYAYLPFDPLSDTHIFSINYKFK
ncbi:MAG: PorV/PorQ family protein [Elusimicrobia bacterium]|nr:PorV/PorQ family protein [Elusimicrobiota bacterium]